MTKQQSIYVLELAELLPEFAEIYEHPCHYIPFTELDHESDIIDLLQEYNPDEIYNRVN